jgi:hypothetical protein
LLANQNGHQLEGKLLGITVPKGEDETRRNAVYKSKPEQLLDQ